MKLRYDPGSGTLYMRITEGKIVETVQHAGLLCEGIVLPVPVQSALAL